MRKEVIVPDLFVETKQAVAAYQAEMQLLNLQENELSAELEALKKEMTENILSQEYGTVSDKVHFKIRGKEISSRANIINSVLEELAEERHMLKLKYVSIYRQSLGVDGNVKRQFNGNEIVDRYLWEMLSELTSIGQQMGKQYREMYDDMAEVFQDEKVKKEIRNVQYTFTSESYRPEFWNNSNTVLHKQNVLLATGGSMPPNFKKPKEAN